MYNGTTAELATVDPADLLTDSSIRHDLRLTDAFRESIAGQGVLTPITVCRTAAGPLRVLTGPRRTAAALDAGLTQIPALIVGDEGDGTDAAVERLVTQRREVIENNREWRAATEVRRKWIAQQTTRKTAPKGTASFVATVLTKWPQIPAAYHARTLAEQMLPTSDTLAKLASATDPRALVLLCAHILIALESQVGVEHWRKPTDLSQFYLRAIEGQGYTLADIERRAAGLDPPRRAVTPLPVGGRIGRPPGQTTRRVPAPARMAVDRGIEPRSTAPARSSPTHHKRIKKQP